jgi:hypothetical protein
MTRTTGLQLAMGVVWFDTKALYPEAMPGLLAGIWDVKDG